jgi:myo-inositol-1(or 4)-monophosphatase
MIDDFLPTPNGSPLMHTMVQATRNIAKILVRDFGELEQLQTAPNSIDGFAKKSIAFVEKKTLDLLHASRPNFGIIRGEDGYVFKKDPKTHWVFWSINGIENYAHGIPYFCFVLMVYKDDFPIGGIIYNPISDEMFCAEQGRGAYAMRRRLRVSRRLNQHGIIIASATNTSLGLFKKSHHQQRVTGSSMLNIAYGAAGRYDLVVESLNHQDLLIAQLFFHESGGILQPMDQDKKNTTTLDRQYCLGHEFLLKSFSS